MKDGNKQTRTKRANREAKRHTKKKKKKKKKKNNNNKNNKQKPWTFLPICRKPLRKRAEEHKEVFDSFDGDGSGEIDTGTCRAVDELGIHVDQGGAAADR